MATSPKTKLSEFFRSNLNSRTSDAIPFFNNNADAQSLPPYGVVTVTEVRETTPFSNVYRGEVKVAIITSIDMSSSVEHDTLLEEVMLALDNIPRRVIDEVNNIRLFGWVITSSEAITKDESQSFSDVITILAGCSG